MTTLKQKIALIASGVAIAVILVEIILRLAGGVFLALQERQNAKGSFAEDTYRILCIGESMTALGDEASYPRQLEELLNQATTHKKFKVINKGIPAVNTNYIRAHIKEYVEEYKPDLVIAMIGINDELGPRVLEQSAQNEEGRFFNNFRVVKLAKLISSHLRVKFSKNNLTQIEKELLNKEQTEDFNDIKWIDKDVSIHSLIELLGPLRAEKESINARLAKNVEGTAPYLALEGELRDVIVKETKSLLRIGNWYVEEGDFPQAEAYLKQAITLMPNNFLLYRALGQCYKRQNKLQRAVKMYEASIKVNPDQDLVFLELGRMLDATGEVDKARKVFTHLLQKNRESFNSFWTNVEIGDWFVKNKFFAEAELAYKSAITVNLGNTMVFDKLGKLYLQNKLYKQAEQIYRQGLDIHTQSHVLYAGLAKSYQGQGKVDLAEDNLKKSEYYFNHQIHPITLRNYEHIAKTILERGITMISLEYPLRTNTVLKKSLKDAGKIVFVSNKTNFEQALSNSEYSEIFSDLFARDFGHCTLKGNRLIASRLKDVILKDILKK